MFALAKARPVAILATLCAAALLTGFQAAQTDVPPGYGPLQLSQGPAIVLPAKVIEAASIYSAYVERAAAISPAFTDGASVASSLKSGESYEVQQMQRGITAYAAIVALQDPTFVAAVHGFGIDPAQRAQVAAMIVQDPRYATVFHGADSAAGLIVATLRDHGQRVLSAGQKVKQAAYDVQHQSWSKAVVADRDGRLALAKSLSSAPSSGAPDDMSRLQQASSGAARMIVAGDPAAPPYTPTVVRALAVAAMAALGEGGEENSDQLYAMLTEPEANDCLNMAKLNLYQCLAVSKPHYEDVFCLGQHILMDTGQCIMKSASPPAVIVPTLVADATPAPKTKAKGKAKVVKHVVKKKVVASNP